MVQTITRELPYGFFAPLHYEEEVVPGVTFGREDELLSPAYWAMRCATANPEAIDFVSRHGSLEEEVGFCLLGGYGVTLEVARAFFERLRAEGVFTPGETFQEKELFTLLNEPAPVNGRPHRYRFPRQRARRIAKAMADLETLDLDPQMPREFRNKIQQLEGVGPKTASWIVRNWLDNDEIAILDIHVLRAGWHIGLFDRLSRLPRDYFQLENRFLIFAQNLKVRASVLDSVMWHDMRTFGSSLARQSSPH